MRPSRAHRQQYAARLMGCLIASLLLLIGLVRLWPAAREASPAPPPVYDAEAGAVQLSAAQPTQQSLAPPPPPLPPVPVPDERVVLDDIPFDLSANALVFADGTTGTAPADGPADASAAAPDVPPRRLSIVEADYPEEAQRRDVRARVIVRVLVGANGHVREAHIRERFLLTDGAARRVDALGYGLDRAALDAARRTLFVPAQAAGAPVESWQTIPIGFGQ